MDSLRLLKEIYDSHIIEIEGGAIVSINGQIFRMQEWVPTSKDILNSKVNEGLVFTKY